MTIIKGVVRLCLPAMRILDWLRQKRRQRERRLFVIRKAVWLKLSRTAKYVMKAVIFAGGVGTRLWPLSRKKSPKQFEKIISEKSTLQLAALRLQPDFPWSKIFVATGKD